MLAEAQEELVYTRPHSLSETFTHYCPGCTHGVAHRLVAEVLDELGMIGNAPTTRISLQRLRSEQVPAHVRAEACASPNEPGVYWRSELIPRPPVPGGA